MLLGQATPEETDVIEYAMASYAAGRGLFEYPILVVDVARDASGKEGDDFNAGASLLQHGIYLPTESRSPRLRLSRRLRDCSIRDFTCTRRTEPN